MLGYGQQPYGTTPYGLGWLDKIITTFHKMGAYTRERIWEKWPFLSNLKS